MKSFIYTYHEKTAKHATVKTVRIYRIVKGTPVFVAEGSDTFVSEFQLVLQTMKAGKLLPSRAFATGPCHSPVYGHAYMLREAGIANINRVS